MSHDESPAFQLTRFHRFHGNNLSLRERDTVAQRENSFSDAVVFSERPLAPGEVFLVEIESRETGWASHVRLGLTQLDPDGMRRTGRPCPPCAIPDMAFVKKKGFKSWVCGLSNRQSWNESDYMKEYFRVDGDHVITPKGTFPTGVLRSGGDDDEIGPADVGSRVGIVYLPCGDNAALMHFIINGEIVLPVPGTIPYKDGPIRAVLDLYGDTKRVRIVQVYDGKKSFHSCTPPPLPPPQTVLIRATDVFRNFAP